MADGWRRAVEAARATREPAPNMFDFGFSQWSNYILVRYTAVGKAGTRRRGTAGDKLHILRVEEVVGLVDRDAPVAANSFAAMFLQRERRLAQMPNRTLPPVIQSINSVCGCGSNGQWAGMIVEGATRDDVNCKLCLPIAHKRERRLAPVRK